MLQPAVWGPWGPRSSGVYFLDLAFLARGCLDGGPDVELGLVVAWSGWQGVVAEQ